MLTLAQGRTLNAALHRKYFTTDLLLLNRSRTGEHKASASLAFFYASATTG
ncbi:hypothetical protein KCP71_12085 [Salmonella enterica subsp. enterica]|nr:hypothetical protein KCP71_12085 [Salmonella enterica subsp. enterica]